MSNVGYTALYNGEKKDLVKIFDTTRAGNISTGFFSSAYNKDLGSIFSSFVFDEITTGYKNSNGVDLGSLFAVSGKVTKYNVLAGSPSISSCNFSTTVSYNTILIFTGNGEIKFNLSVNAYIGIVGGGGAGGQSTQTMAGSGGGGGGQVGIGTVNFEQSVKYNITVGSGGRGYNNTLGNNGGDTTIFGGAILETALGGGGGGGTNQRTGANGGCGGGAYPQGGTQINGGTVLASPNNITRHLTYYGGIGQSTPSYAVENHWCGATGGSAGIAINLGHGASQGSSDVPSYGKHILPMNLWYGVAGEGGASQGRLLDSYGAKEQSYTLNDYYNYATNVMGVKFLYMKPYDTNQARGAGRAGYTPLNGYPSAGVDGTGAGGGGGSGTNYGSGNGANGGSGVCIIAFNV
jgi:hypothetical protein